MPFLGKRAYKTRHCSYYYTLAGSCCVAQGNLKLLGSRQPSCLSLQSHQDVRLCHHAWRRTIYKKSPFKDTYCTHLCTYRRPTCTYCVYDVWVCMLCHLYDISQVTSYPPASTLLCWNYRCLPLYNRFNACLLCAFKEDALQLPSVSIPLFVYFW